VSTNSNQELLKLILVQFHSAKLKNNDNKYAVIKVNSSELMPSIMGSTYLIILNEQYIQYLRKDIYKPRDQLLKEIRLEIKDNLAKFTLLIASSEQNKKYLVNLLNIFHDLRQFPVLSIDEILKVTSSISKNIVELLLNYPYANFFNRLCPYSIDFIPREKLFYGRREYIKAMIEMDSNIVLLGARRIGKTTLAYNLSDALGTIPTTGIKTTSTFIKKCAVIDVSNLSEYGHDIWEKILTAFNYDPSLYMPYARKERGEKLYVHYLKSLDSLLESFNGELVIILDEVDNWIIDDSKGGWKVLNPLRSLSDSGKAKVILIGYETLQSITMRHDFPFAGRYELMTLKPMTRDEVEALIKEPLTQIGVSIEPSYEPELIELIWNLSGGRPNLVQGFCLELVRVISDKDKRIIDKSDFISAKNTSQVYKEYLDSVTLGGNAFARLICGIAAIILFRKQDKQESVSSIEIVSEIEKLGHSYNSDELQMNLMHLELRHILVVINKERGLYRFTDMVIVEEYLKLIDRVTFERWALDLLRKNKKEQNISSYDL